MTATNPRKRDSIERPQKLAADDFVAVIADHLKTVRFRRAQVETAVGREIVYLRTIFADKSRHFGLRAENQAYAREITKLLRKLQRKMNGAPEGTQMALYAFGRYGTELKQPRDVDWEEVARYKIRFLFYLESMGRSCSIIANNPIGSYHTVDPEKQHCAASAFNLMKGLDAGEPASSDENSPLRIIAGNLFEVVCPARTNEWQKLKKKRPDLRHQCGEVLAYWRKQPAAELQRLSREARASWGLQE